MRCLHDEHDDLAGIGPWISGSIRSGAPVEELIARLEDKVETRHVTFVKFAMVRQSKKKGSKGREGSPAGESNTSRPSGPSTSQDHEAPVNPLGAVGGAVGGDGEEMAYQKLSKPFTDTQDKAIAVFFRQHPCFYDQTHDDYKNKEKRTALINEFAHDMFASGKSVFL